MNVVVPFSLSIEARVRLLRLRDSKIADSEHKLYVATVARSHVHKLRFAAELIERRLQARELWR